MRERNRNDCVDEYHHHNQQGKRENEEEIEVEVDEANFHTKKN